jgi:hypothetical protein
LVVNGCPVCLHKQRRIDELEEEIKKPSRDAALSSEPMARMFFRILHGFVQTAAQTQHRTQKEEAPACRFQVTEKRSDRQRW